MLFYMCNYDNIVCIDVSMAFGHRLAEPMNEKLSCLNVWQQEKIVQSRIVPSI